MAIEKVKEAFEAFRQSYPIKDLPKELVANKDQVRPMTEADGLCLWQDGPVEKKPTGPGKAPLVTSEQEAGRMLWVVRDIDVACAPESSDFGKKLESGVIKHSNLTGGSSAYCGGELLSLDDRTVVINGRSGRYGPKTEVELSEVAECFRASGYEVWNMGFDHEVGFPRPFLGSTPEWID